jgi:hypothetical protein
VKFRLAPPIAHRVYLIDLLDWLDFVAFDAGPGQIMLREADFYDAYEGGARPSGATIQGKVEKLFSRFEDATQRLFNNRQKRLDRQRGLLKAFTAESAFVVDQSSMHFVP